MQLQPPSNVEAEAAYREASQRYLQVLRQAIHDAEQHQDNLQPFFPNIDNLQNEISVQQLRFHFYSVLKLTKKNWIPKGNIENVIRACVNGQCEKSDVTIDFYRHGGIHAVIALYLATKDYNWVFAQIEALSEEWRKILIEEAKRIKVNDLIPAWIGACDRSPIREDEEAPRLNRHSKEKIGTKRQRPRPAPFNNDQMPTPKPVCTAPLLGSAHSQIPHPHQIQPHADHIPSAAQKHPEDGCGTQVSTHIQLPPLSSIQRHPRFEDSQYLFNNDEQRCSTVTDGSVPHPSLQNEHESPEKENREMKYMYTNALASNILKMPEPFKTAIENSRLWKWERSQELQTTGCWPSLFPKNHRQDVSFTIWCDNKDGERLTDFFGGQLEMSS